MDDVVASIEALRASKVGTPAAHLRALAFCAVMLGVFGAAWPYSEATVCAPAHYPVPAVMTAQHGVPPAAPASAPRPAPPNFATQTLAANFSALRPGQESRQRSHRPHRSSHGTSRWGETGTPSRYTASNTVPAVWRIPAVAHGRLPGLRAPPRNSSWTCTHRPSNEVDARLRGRLLSRESDFQHSAARYLHSLSGTCSSGPSCGAASSCASGARAFEINRAVRTSCCL